MKTFLIVTSVFLVSCTSPATRQPASTTSMTSAQTQSQLKGIWKLQKFECSSGAKYGANVNTPSLIDRATLVIGNNSANVFLTVTFSYAPGYARSQRDQLTKMVSEITRDTPDSVEKQKELGGLDLVLNQINTYAAGVTCLVHETMRVRVQGENLTIGSPYLHTSTCAYDSGRQAGPTRTEIVEMSGNQMRIIDPLIETSDDNACPKGDYQISTWRRL